MAQCVSQSASTGSRCRRPSVAGAEVCAGHGGLTKSVTPDLIRKKHQRVKCRATLAGSGGATPCGNWAAKGTTVCRFHGAATSQVKRKARERLLDMIDPAVSHLQKIIEKDSTSDADRLRAIQMLLDRTGYGPKSEMVVEARPWEAVMEDITVIVDVGTDPASVVAGGSGDPATAITQGRTGTDVESLTTPESHPVLASPRVPGHLL